jgi:hypothetical protein
MKTLQPLKPYVYIICELVDGYPSFRHAFIDAANDDDAYFVGGRALEQPHGNGLNDYVIDLSKRGHDARD